MKGIDKKNPNRSLVLFAGVAVGGLDLEGQIWFGVSRYGLCVVWYLVQAWRAKRVQQANVQHWKLGFSFVALFFLLGLSLSEPPQLYWVVAYHLLQPFIFVLPFLTFILVPLCNEFSLFSKKKKKHLHIGYVGAYS